MKPLLNRRQLVKLAKHKYIPSTYVNLWRWVKAVWMVKDKTSTRLDWRGLQMEIPLIEKEAE